MGVQLKRSEETGADRPSSCGLPWWCSSGLFDHWGRRGEDCLPRLSGEPPHDAAQSWAPGVQRAHAL